MSDVQHQAAERDDEEGPDAHTASPYLRRIRRLNAALAGLLALTLTATGLAMWQHQSVLTAQSRQLAAHSQALLDSDVELASLLAVQAYRTSPTQEATASLYNAADLGLEDSFDTDSDGVGSVAFSPDGTTLATAGLATAGGGIGAGLRLWDTATGELLQTFHGHGGNILNAAFSPDGATLATGTDEGAIDLWDTTTGHLRTLTGHESFVNAVAFSPDGATLATGSEDATVRLWDTATGEQLHALSDDHGEVFDVAFSPDGATLATGNEDGTARLWDTATNEELRTIDPGGDVQVYDVVFGSGGDVLVTNTTTAVSLWDTRTGSEVQTLTATDDIRVDTVTVGPDGTTLAYSLTDGRIRLWDSTGTTLPHTLVRGPNQVFDLAFSPDGTSLATGSLENGTAHLWDAARYVLDVEDGWGDVAFGPDGSTFVTTDTVGEVTVHLWDAATGERRRTLSARGNEVFDPAFSSEDDLFDWAFSPNGSALALTHEYGAVWLWDTATGEQLHTFVLGGEKVWDTALSADGETLATVQGRGDAETVIRLWNAATGERLRTLTEYDDASMSELEFSPDGSLLATDVDSATHLWDTATGEKLHILPLDEGRMSSMEFSPDGSLLATGVSGATHLWDTATGKLRRTFPSSGSVELLAFSPDGTRLATSAGTDDGVRVWDVDLPDAEEAVTQICGAFGRDFTADERVLHLSGLPDGPACPGR